MFDAKAHYSALVQGGDPPYFFKNPEHIKFDFDQGQPDPLTFPGEDLTRIASNILDREGPQALNYIDERFGYTDLSMGLTSLREQIAAHVSEREGITQDPMGIIVTNGSVQGLALAIGAYLGKGDAVFVEAASFPFGMRYFGQSGAEIFPIEMDRDGLLPDSFEQQVKAAQAKGLRANVIYTISTFQLPTTTVLPLDRRLRLLEIAREYDILVIEDAIYAPFRYSGEPVPSLYSLDTDGRVIQSDSFAKTIAPATRLGWMAGSPEVILGLAMARQDLGPNQWMAKVITDYMAEGLLPAQIQKSIDCYRPKRDAAANALTKYCGEHVDFLIPDGGWYYWLELDEDIDWPTVQAHAYDLGIAMRPGEMFMGQTKGRGHVRMAFVQAPIPEIEGGMEAFGKALQMTIDGVKPVGPPA